MEDNLIDTHKLSKIQTLVNLLIVANRKELNYRVNIIRDNYYNNSHLKRMKKRHTDNTLMVEHYKKQITNLINEL